MKSQLTTTEISRRLAALPETGRPMSGLEIAHRTGIPQPTICRIEQRAIQKLRRGLRQLHPALMGELCQCPI